MRRIPNRSAIFTRSAKDFAPIFRVTLPRCTFNRNLRYADFCRDLLV